MIGKDMDTYTMITNIDIDIDTYPISWLCIEVEKYKKV